MPAKKRDHEESLTGAALIKETCRRDRVAVGGYVNPQRGIQDGSRPPAERKFKIKMPGPASRRLSESPSNPEPCHFEA